MFEIMDTNKPHYGHRGQKAMALGNADHIKLEVSSLFCIHSSEQRIYVLQTAIFHDVRRKQKCLILENGRVRLSLFNARFLNLSA